LVGPDVAIYASTEVCADRRDGLPVRYLPLSREMLRGFAAGYLASGADGVNTFNFFLTHHHVPETGEEYYGRLKEMRSLEYTRSQPRTHVLSDAFWLPECDMPVQVPVLIREWRERKFEMLLAAETKDAKVTALVYFDGENGPDDMWLRIGQDTGSQSIEIRQGPEGDEENESSRKSKIAVFEVPHGVIQDGKNDLVVRTGKVDTTILGIDVEVR